MFSNEILQVAQSKMRGALTVSDEQMQNARALVIANQVKPYRAIRRYPDSFRVRSQTQRIWYAVDVAALDCQCEHGRHQAAKSFNDRRTCAHIAAAFLFRYCQAELRRRAEGERTSARRFDRIESLSKARKPQHDILVAL